MSSGTKEIISFLGIAALVLAIVLISWSRQRLSGILGMIVSTIAFLCLLFGGLVVLFIVFSGPTGV